MHNSNQNRSLFHYICTGRFSWLGKPTMNRRTMHRNDSRRNDVVAAADNTVAVVRSGNAENKDLIRKSFRNNWVDDFQKSCRSNRSILGAGNHLRTPAAIRRLKVGNSCLRTRSAAGFPIRRCRRTCAWNLLERPKPSILSTAMPET